jgi:hypothetical protein
MWATVQAVAMCATAERSNNVLKHKRLMRHNYVCYRTGHGNVCYC